MLKNLILGIVFLSAFTGCLKSDFPDPCAYEPCDLKAPASEIQQVEDYLAVNNITAVQHCSGLFYEIVAMGTGATPEVCSNVTVTYQGKLANGTQFDAATNPVTFNLSQVINGWKNGIPQIKAGGIINLYIPPTLGYGSSNVGSIPPNSILVFNVNLVAVQ